MVSGIGENDDQASSTERRHSVQTRHMAPVLWWTAGQLIKKQELPIKKLLLGQPLEKVVNRDAMANPACLDWYVAFAARRLAGTVA